METEILLDTHVVLWLYNGDLDRLSPKVRDSVATAATVLISPITVLELDFLFEIKRLKEEPLIVMEYMQSRGRCEVAMDAYLDIVRMAVGLSWTRDPFDRLLTAHARLREYPLLTKDRQIRKHYSKSVW